MNTRSVADILGPWVESDWKSGLVERCRKYWQVPIDRLPNEMLAAFLRQRIATDDVLTEALLRLRTGFNDDSGLYEGELAAAVNEELLRRGQPMIKIDFKD